MNVLLRDKHLAYAAIFAIGFGLFYLYSHGYTNWLYNFVLYQRWTASDITGVAKNLSQIVAHRIYCLAIAVFLLTVAHLFFERKLTRGLMDGTGLTERGWSILFMSIPAVTAAVAAIMTIAK